MIRPSQRTKLLQGRGTGTFANYIPWYFIREENSDGTCSAINDFKHGRQMQLLSIAELKVYLENRWRDDVLDIREQFPILNVNETARIATELGYEHPMYEGELAIMTTDLLIVKTDGTFEAISVKVNEDALGDDNSTTRKKLRIEETFWLRHRIPWKLVYGDSISHEFAENICSVTRYYDGIKVHDPFSMAKHLVARKKITVNLDEPIDWAYLVRRYNIHVS